MTREIQSLIESFVVDLRNVVREEVRDEMMASLSGKPGARTVRTSLSTLNSGVGLIKRARRKGPIQLCPVPGCKNPAAPVFGMVCANHKSLPKATIKKFREARRAAKDKGGKVIPIRAGMKKTKQRAKKVVAKKVSAKKTTAKKKTHVEKVPAAA